MKDHELKTVCPHCKARNNTNTDTLPREGDVGICFVCGEAMVFDGKGGVRKPDAEDEEFIASDPKIRKMQMLWKLVTAGRMM